MIRRMPWPAEPGEASRHATLDPRNVAAVAAATSLLLAIAVAVPAVVHADEIVTGPVDKATFQAIVDGAAAGDTIACLPGTYDFSAAGPVLLTKQLTIAAADPNDPPLFQGAVDAAGAPQEIGMPLEGNTAFAVPGGTALRGLALDGLSFAGFNRTIVLYDGFDDQQAGCPAVGERARDVRLTGLVVDNSNQGVQAIGGPHRGLSVEGARITARQLAITVQGVVGCVDPFGGFRLVDDTDRVFGMTIRGNELNAGNHAIIAAYTKNAAIADNRIQAGSIGVLVAEYPDGGEGAVHVARVADNEISAGLAGLYGQVLAGDSRTRAQFQNNSVAGAFVGVYLDAGVNGWNVLNTTFSGVLALEAYLEAGTHDNDLKLSRGDRYCDLGDNRVKGGAEGC